MITRDQAINAVLEIYHWIEYAEVNRNLPKWMDLAAIRAFEKNLKGHQIEVLREAKNQFNETGSI